MGIAIVLLIGFVVLVGKHGATDVTAYRHNKEAPSIEKFRTRHREKADKKLTEPKRSGGKTPGPTRQWARAVTDNAAAELIDRQNTKSRARRKWYEQNAPQREQQWREKWQRKLDKREEKVRRFGQRRGVIERQPDTVEATTTATSPDSGDTPTDTGTEQNTTDQQQDHLTEDTTDDDKQGHDLTAREQESEDTAAPTKPIPETDAARADEGESSPSHSSTSTPFTPSSPSTATSGGTVYQQAVQELHESAEEVRLYCQEMTAFADGLSGRGFGAGITGQAAELVTGLQPAADAYADLADDIQAQGDEVRDAYEKAPDIPKDAAMA